jgi:hypothetical protein
MKSRPDRFASAAEVVYRSGAVAATYSAMAFVYALAAGQSMSRATGTMT